MKTSRSYRHVKTKKSISLCREVFARIEGKRTGLGMSIQELCRRSRITPRNYRYFRDNPKRDIKLGTLSRLAISLEFPLVKLLRGF